ncbi:hypothetical protein L7F22_065444 [Adiantum nelumboides]|nr:hypothetical protein [Adiantum nelumboides]
MQFNIYIDISIGYGNSATRLTLNPNNLVDVNNDKTVIARLEGDLLSYKMPPSFSSVFLSHPPNPNRINASEWLIIDRHKYTESGAVCDLIGSSYEAFTLVNLPCTRNVGYCLSYQLGDYIKEEVNRMARGLQPYLSVARYGAVHSSKNAHNIEILLIPLNQTQNSIVVLELSADNLEFIVSRSPGKIISVKSSKFEALSHDGYSDITVVNTGELVAAFTLGVDCPIGIQASPVSLV